MAIKEIVFVLIKLIFIFAVLLTIAAIAIAIWFQRIRKKIEAEIKAGKSTENEIVAKMTVKSRKRENKYSKNRKRVCDREPEFYDSPPMRDEHREILQMKTIQKQEENEVENDVSSSRDQVTQLPASHMVSRHAVTMPRDLKIEDSYIVVIGDDEHTQRMTTFQGTKVSSKGESVLQAQQKYKSHATTMPRTLMKEDSHIEYSGGNEDVQRMSTFQSAKASSEKESVTQAQQKYKSHATPISCTLQREDIDGNPNRKVNPQARPLNPSSGATLPIFPPLPIKKGHGHGIKDGFRDTVPQQQVSRNTSLVSANEHGKEVYKIMEKNSEIYENTGYVVDSSEDVYGNQEIIEEENKKRSQINMEQLPKHSRNWNLQTPNYHEDGYEEELYENQEIVEQERRKRAQSDASSGQIELYENYVAEDMYENC